MNELKELIDFHKKDFEHFEYYYLLIEKIENNLIKQPDITIECCKSLIEGISKTILLSLDESLNEQYILKNYNLQKIIKECKSKLSENNFNFEIEFLNGFDHNIKLIGEIRTKRGDIAHGKSSPKEEESTFIFAKFIKNFTNSYLVYILESYYEIESLYKLKYYDYPNFNDILDEEIELGGKLRYSLALFQQDPIEYNTRLEKFLQLIAEIDEETE